MSDSGTKILIGYLNDGRRFEYLEMFIELLSSSKRKNNYKILFLTPKENYNKINSIFQRNPIREANIFASQDPKDSNRDISEDKSIDYIRSANAVPLEYDFIYKTEYMDKIYSFIDYAEKNNYKYCFKMDCDILLPSHIFDYISELTNNMDSNSANMIFPTMSTSIPGMYFFMEDFFSKEERQFMMELFKTYRYTKEWSTLNDQLPESFDLEEYHKFVEGITNPYGGNYKAIHPIRFSGDILKKFNDILLKKKENLFIKNNEPYIKIEKSYYFMPQSFVIETNFFKKIRDNTLHFDGYDEVSLNRLIRRDISPREDGIRGANIAFIRNCFGIHPTHNGFLENFIEYEKEFLKKLKS